MSVILMTTADHSRGLIKKNNEEVKHRKINFPMLKLSRIKIWINKYFIILAPYGAFEGLIEQIIQKVEFDRPGKRSPE